MKTMVSVDVQPAPHLNVSGTYKKKTTGYGLLPIFIFHQPPATCLNIIRFGNNTLVCFLTETLPEYHPITVSIFCQPR
jgi:hypothetical protein